MTSRQKAWKEAELGASGITIFPPVRKPLAGSVDHMQRSPCWSIRNVQLLARVRISAYRHDMALGAFLALSISAADAAPPAFPPPPPPPAALDRAGADTWFLRFGLGFGSRLGSAHNDLVEQDGYHLTPRGWLSADGAYVVRYPWFAGPWLAYGWSSDEPDYAPRLHERDVMLGAQAPFVAEFDTGMLILSPRVGAAATWLWLSSADRAAWGPALGLDASIVVAHLGVGVAAYWASTSAPSNLGERYNVGGLQFNLWIVPHD